MKKRILIVEDDTFLRELYAELLEGEGYEVVTASDGSQGLIRMREGGWDLTLLDIMLPVFDGFQLMKMVKDVPPEKPLGPVVYLTNLSDEDSRDKGMEQGSREYWVKSQLTPGLMLQKVKAALIDYK